jgi:formylglycine-generating enzyme required for sulfatase activity
MLDITILRGQPYRQVVLFSTAAMIALITLNFLSTFRSAVSVLHERGKDGLFYRFDSKLEAWDDPVFWRNNQETADSSVRLALHINTLTPTSTSTLTPSPTPTFTLTPTTTPTPTYTPTPTFTPTLTMTPIPGTSRSSTVDGMVSLFIPAGDFLMGDEPPREGIQRDNQPEHVVYVNAYWINRTQVTNAMYAACVNSGACQLPIRQEINPHYYDPAFANHPAVYVNWYLAEAYCVWTGGHLPTEAQWEHAAAGYGRRLYAWGEQDPSPDLVTDSNFFDTTTEVGSHPAGASPYGVLDMGGNVREWVADWYAGGYFSVSPYDDPRGPDGGELKVLKGASWHDPDRYSRTTSRYKHDPNSAGNNRGFRCAFP